MKNVFFLTTREQMNVQIYTNRGERVRHTCTCTCTCRLWGTCNNRTMVPHKEIQWNNGTPQEKFYRLATLHVCHNREDNQVPHVPYTVCPVGVCACVWWCVGCWPVHFFHNVQERHLYSEYFMPCVYNLHMYWRTQTTLCKRLWVLN